MPRSGLRVTNGHGKIIVRIDEDRLRELWATPVPIMDVCWALGAYHSEVVARARRLGLPPRPKYQHEEVEVTPTPEEIEERSAAIRQTRWTEEDHMRRASRHCGWSVPNASAR